jgi:hypothetical protein
MARRFLLFFLSAAAFAQEPAVFAQIDEMLTTLSEITGWKVQKKVPAETLGKDKFRQLVETSIKQSTSDKELHAEELALKMFGLVPEDFNLAQESADLYTEQAAAFYDFRKKRLFLLETTTGDAEQRMAVVHELAHALADQRHSIGKYMKRGSPDDDATSARQAVTEGQATWLTWAYLSKRTSGKPEVPRAVVEQIASQVGATGEDYPVLAKAPLYIRESLVFPYTEGMRFQDAVYRERGREGFDEVFERPPASTQQILHANAYLAGTQPTNPQLPALKDFAGSESGKLRTLIQGRLGEFDISVLLRQYASEREGAAAASHLRGGAFQVSEHKTEKYPVLLHTVQWDSPESARRYFELYQVVLRRKWKSLEAAHSSATEYTGKGDTGRFVLRLNGDTVQSVEGLR